MFWRLLVVPFVVLIIGSCSHGQTASTALAPTGAPIDSAASAGGSIRLAVPKMLGLQGAPLHLALSEDYFSRSRVRVSTITVENPYEAREAVVAGQADMAVLPLHAVALSVDGANPFVAVGAISYGNPLNVVVAEDTAVQRRLLDGRSFEQRMADLKGLRIGLPRGAIARKTIVEILQAGGLQPERDVELVVLEQPELVPAFRARVVDVLVAHHPDVDTALGDAGAVFLLHTSIGRGPTPAAQSMAWYVLAVERKHWDKLSADIRGTLSGLQDAQFAINGEPALATARLRQRFASLSDNAYAQGVKVYFPSIPTSPVISVAAYENALRAVGVAAPPFSAVVDLSLIPAT